MTEARDFGNERGLEPEAAQRVTELRRRFQWLEQFSDDELRELTIRAEGDELEPGKEYFDLSHPEAGIITAPAGRRVPHKSAYIRRDELPEHLWEKLLAGRIGQWRQAS